MLTVERLTKKFQGSVQVDAVKEANLSVAPGEFVAIVGRSGSGKSTLLSMIGGLMRPTSGKVALVTVDQWQLSSAEHADLRNQEIGFVFQFASLLPSLRAIDNVALPALIAGNRDGQEVYAEARRLLEQFIT